ncbi:hypothetical protein MRB58_20490 [Acuticoccus sp. I52.16.1]|nr:hypothetical protein [Acuticoccus sp. I52.16.1]UOM36991.1 hypothetical protein MRB58_20490 [Acuticoccus sp. I52.16.1]
MREWVEARGGRPCHVADTASKNDLGVLRIDFKEPDEGLAEVSWDSFLSTFDEKGLAFLFREKTKSGRTSRFHKFVERS